LAALAALAALLAASFSALAAAASAFFLAAASAFMRSASSAAALSAACFSRHAAHPPHPALGQTPNLSLFLSPFLGGKPRLGWGVQHRACEEEEACHWLGRTA